MRTMAALLLAGGFIAAIAGPALACRGTAEFPQAAGEVAQSKIPPERKKALTEQLRQGEAMHTEGHRTGDMMKLGESLRILDGILGQIGK